MSTIRFTLEAAVPRLDRCLTDRFPEIPRSQWDNWIRGGEVRVNGEVNTKGGQRMKAGDEVETELPDRIAPGAHLEPESIEVPTLFEDERLWIVNKPAGLVVHPGPGHPGGTLVNALLGRLRDARLARQVPTGESDSDDEEDPLWPGLVHRLDRYTTGCIAMAKDLEAQAALQAQFKERTVEKLYLALVRHSRRLPELGSVLVDEPLARHRLERLRMTISAHGRPSQTRVKVLARAGGVALVACELLTGRTHQIRVHLSHLGAPILGDPMYGGATRWQDVDRRAVACEHPMLHSWKLALDHPTTGERVRVEAPLPEPFQVLLGRLGLALPTSS
jgi:23S rRNA pseudouridine1911/1915/1917 synthase